MGNTATTDIGLDFGFFNHRLTGEIDYYNKYTSDILYHPELYLSMGVVGSAPENLGEVRNRGVEFTLNWNDRIGKFNYYAKFNFATSENRVVFIDDPKNQSEYLEKSRKVNRICE